MICYRSTCTLLGWIAVAAVLLGRPGAAQSLAPLDCFGRTTEVFCAGISFAEAESLLGVPTNNQVASVLHPHTATIDRDTAISGTGFSPPPFGLDPGTPFRATAQRSPHTVSPTTTYEIDLQASGAIDATLPVGEASTFQKVGWTTTFNTTLIFNGPNATVDVQLSYDADAQFSAPRGAKDRPDSGMMHLVGGLLLSESETVAAAPLVEYYGEFVFLPSHPTHPATGSNDWAPEDVADIGLQDAIDVDAQLEEAALSVSDELTFTVTSGTSYDLEGFFTGGANGEIYLDPSAPGQLRWETIGDAAAVVRLEVLTPGATLIAAIPVPEGAAASGLLAALSALLLRRRCSVRIG